MSWWLSHKPSLAVFPHIISLLTCLSSLALLVLSTMATWKNKRKRTTPIRWYVPIATCKHVMALPTAKARWFRFAAAEDPLPAVAAASPTIHIE